MAIKILRTTMDHFSAPGLWQPPEATRLAQLNPCPHLKGKSSQSSMHPILKVAGVVHIWYYIPLCTIFSQQFNGDDFMTKFHYYKSMSQNTKPILKEDSSALQSGNPWRLSEDYSRTPTTWTCRSWVGSSSQDYSKGAFLRGIISFQWIVKAASTPASIGKFNWFIQVILKYPV
ncbi:hypothetical protein O181_106549 [Austropuccinia psidii MF-1]|uniref:Uncharacterized protein n=1 Tax=Austropuccinia psidii MF-1 TaxID=1389203 RepID=A0A9Q3JRK2_9BASI|nr:hypothetical protein [Austropuccinia psidii MF-1]